MIFQANKDLLYYWMALTQLLSLVCFLLCITRFGNNGSFFIPSRFYTFSQAKYKFHYISQDIWNTPIPIPSTGSNDAMEEISKVDLELLSSFGNHFMSGFETSPEIPAYTNTVSCSLHFFTKTQFQISKFTKFFDQYNRSNLK